MKKRIISLAVALLLLAASAHAAGMSSAEADFIDRLSRAEGGSIQEAQEYIDEMTRLEGVLSDETVSNYLEYLWIISDTLTDEYWDDYEFGELLPPEWVVSARFGEGGVSFGPNYAAIYDILGGKLSDAYNQYFSLTAKYLTGYLVDDMALMISWDDLAQWLIDWSAFEAEYPDFVDIDEVWGNLRFGMYLYAGCFNLDNTPMIDFSKNTLTPEVRSSYEKFLADPASESCIYYDEIKALYGLWRDNNFVCSAEVQDHIESIDAFLYEDFDDDDD